MKRFHVTFCLNAVDEPACTLNNLTGSQQSCLSLLHPPRSIYLSLTAIRLISLHLSLAQHACDGTSDCEKDLEVKEVLTGPTLFPPERFT